MNDDASLVSLFQEAANDLKLRLAAPSCVFAAELNSWLTHWKSLHSTNFNLIGLLLTHADGARMAHMHESGKARPPQQQVVLLVYGIRDNGGWQQRAAAALQRHPDIIAKPVKFDWFDGISFVSPFGLNTAPYDALLNAYSAVKSLHPKARVSVIAHSFGTYLVGRLLALHPTVELHRVILCGSVLQRGYRWDEVQDKISRRSDGSLAVLNECGDADYWPVVAKSMNRRYGDAGRHGFTHGVHVETAWFRGGHGCFFEGRHFEDVWTPFITGNDAAAGIRGTSSQPAMTAYERCRETLSCICLVGFFLALLLVLFRRIVVPFALVVMAIVMWLAYRWFNGAA